MSGKFYLLNEVAKKIGVNSFLIILWEDEFRLKIPRNDANYRYYCEEHLEILGKIKNAKADNHSWEEIMYLVHGVMPERRKFSKEAEYLKRKKQLCQYFDVYDVYVDKESAINPLFKRLLENVEIRKETIEVDRIIRIPGESELLEFIKNEELSIEERERIKKLIEDRTGKYEQGKVRFWRYSEAIEDIIKKDIAHNRRLVITSDKKLIEKITAIPEYKEKRAEGRVLLKTLTEGGWLENISAEKFEPEEVKIKIDTGDRVIIQNVGEFSLGDKAKMAENILKSFDVGFGGWTAVILDESYEMTALEKGGKQVGFIYRKA